jgi:adenylate kinase family enzyme
VAHLELDGLYHLPGWQPANDEQFAASLAQLLAGPGRDGWVVDGNYRRHTKGLEPDLVVWLDLPRPTAMVRLARRRLERGVQRRETRTSPRCPRRR